jgi:PHD/YefM family antitoxin component YafN of YafNO toxin-antitoxin module
MVPLVQSNEGFMKSYTTTELKFNRPQVFNEVSDTGVVLLTHRDRPDMYIMSQKYVAQMMADKFEEGRKAVQK